MRTSRCGRRAWRSATCCRFFPRWTRWATGHSRSGVARPSTPRLRFLDENPWERLRTIKQHCPNTPLQMLLRGQNLVGYHHYSDEIVNRFVLRVEAQRHRGLPGLRRAQRHPQRGRLGRGGQGVWRPLRGRHLLHGEPRAHARLVPRVRAGAQGSRRRHDLHQGHGGHADAVPYREDGARAQERDRAPGARALPLHRRHGPDELRQGRRGRCRHRRHRGRLTGLRQQPARGRDHRRGAHGVAVRHRPRPGPALRDRRVLGGRPRAQAAQARHHHAAVDGGLQPPGSGRHDEQPGLAARGAEGERPSRRRA